MRGTPTCKARSDAGSVATHAIEEDFVDDAIDRGAMARHGGPNAVTAVAGCDTFESTGDRISVTTSHAIQVDPDCSGTQPR